MGWFFALLALLVIEPFVLFWLLWFNVKPLPDLNKSQTQREVFRRLFRSKGFWSWAIYSVAFTTFIIISYTR